MTDDSNPVIETDRLILRQLREEDWRAVHEYASDTKVTRFMPWGPNTEDQTREFIRGVLESAAESPRTKYGFAITLKESGKLIGGCGLYLRDERRQAYIGYVLRADSWGRGLAAEVARALISFGFRELGLHRIFATCDAENLASARVLEKAGMRREGLMRQDVKMKDSWRDTLCFAVLREEWEAATRHRKPPLS